MTRLRTEAQHSVAVHWTEAAVGITRPHVEETVVVLELHQGCKAILEVCTQTRVNTGRAASLRVPARAASQLCVVGCLVLHDR